MKSSQPLPQVSKSFPTLHQLLLQPVAVVMVTVAVNEVKILEVEAMNAATVAVMHLLSHPARLGTFLDRYGTSTLLKFWASGKNTLMDADTMNDVGDTHILNVAIFKHGSPTMVSIL